jgi:hypothetical protein
MSNRFRLLSVKNAELLAGLSLLVQRGNELTAEVLAHLAELEERRLHLQLGFRSLFAYCVEALGLSEGSAGRRVAGARVCRRFPEAFELVARGDLHLSALCGLAPHLDAQNATELFAACCRKTRRQVDELLAARFPKPDVREQIRRLPVRREIEPLSVDRFGVHLTADAELRELIERARALASHRLPNNDLSSLMRVVLASFVKHEEARRFAIGRKPRRAKAGAPDAQASPVPATPPGGATPATTSAEETALAGSRASEVAPAAARFAKRGKRSRYISAAVRRAVYLRDHARCSFVSDDGRRCESRALLELDHIEPWATQGDAEVENIRLRCRAHNQLHARACFGAQHVETKIASQRRLARNVRAAR